MNNNQIQWKPLEEQYFEKSGELVEENRSIYANGQSQRFDAIRTAFPNVPLYKRTFDGHEDFVYVIYAADEIMYGHYKIGKSKDVVSRIRSLQTSNPYRLKVAFVTNFFDEKTFHQWLAPYRMEGEWFKIPVRHDLLADNFERFLLTEANLPFYELLALISSVKLTAHYRGARDQARLRGERIAPYY